MAYQTSKQAYNGEAIVIAFARFASGSCANREDV